MTPDDMHLENHAITIEMLHTLAEHLGVYFKPTVDGSYTLEKITDKD